MRRTLPYPTPVCHPLLPPGTHAVEPAGVLHPRREAAAHPHRAAARGPPVRPAGVERPPRWSPPPLPREGWHSAGCIWQLISQGLWAFPGRFHRGLPAKCLSASEGGSHKRTCWDDSPLLTALAGVGHRWGREERGEGGATLSTGGGRRRQTVPCLGGPTAGRFPTARAGPLPAVLPAADRPDA